MRFFSFFLALSLMFGMNIAPALAANNVKLVHQTVRLFAESKNGDTGGVAATGFPIDKETIMTAGHFCAAVKDNAAVLKQEIFMSFLNANDEISTLGGGAIVRYDFDEKIDLCLIKLEKHGLKPLKFANYDRVKVGQKITIIGAPMGLIYPNVTEGYVTQKWTEEFPVPALNGKLLTSAPVFSGNSGGPVFDESGKVVGVLVMASAKYEHLSFAIPGDYIKDWLEKE